MKIKLTQIRKEVDPYLDKISERPKKAEEAEKLSNEFLLIKAYLADCLEQVETTAGSLKGIEKATYSQAVLDVPKPEKGKDLAVSAKEHIANTNEGYLDVVEERAKADAMYAWIRTHIDIFSDAVVTFRKTAERLSGR